jgi:hypothetical protein
MNINKEQQFGEGIEIWKAVRRKMVGGLTLQPHELSGKRKDAIGWGSLVLAPDVGVLWDKDSGVLIQSKNNLTLGIYFWS